MICQRCEAGDHSGHNSALAEICVGCACPVTPPECSPTCAPHLFMFCSPECEDADIARRAAESEAAIS